MDNENGNDTASESSKASLHSDISVDQPKKLCEICVINVGEKDIMTCLLCKDAGEHFCTTPYVEKLWVCDECEACYQNFDTEEESSNRTDSSSRTDQSADKKFMVTSDIISETSLLLDVNEGMVKSAETSQLGEADKGKITSAQISKTRQVSEADKGKITSAQISKTHQVSEADEDMATSEYYNQISKTHQVSEADKDMSTSNDKISKRHQLSEEDKGMATSAQISKTNQVSEADEDMATSEYYNQNSETDLLSEADKDMATSKYYDQISETPQLSEADKDMSTSDQLSQASSSSDEHMDTSSDEMQKLQDSYIPSDSESAN